MSAELGMIDVQRLGFGLPLWSLELCWLAAKRLAKVLKRSATGDLFEGLS